MTCPKKRWFPTMKTIEIDSLKYRTCLPNCRESTCQQSPSFSLAENAKYQEQNKVQQTTLKLGLLTQCFDARATDKLQPVD